MCAVIYDFEVAKIGTGHTGCETVLLTTNSDMVSNISCNPANSGSRKGKSSVRLTPSTSRPTALRRSFLGGGIVAQVLCLKRHQEVRHG